MSAERRTMAAFRKALDRGDVVDAIMIAPFGCTSQVTPTGYRFTIYRGSDSAVAEAPTLLEAVRAASAHLPVVSPPEPNQPT